MGPVFCMGYSVEDLLVLVDRLAGHLDAQPLHDLKVDGGEHDRGVSLAAAEPGKRVQDRSGLRIVSRGSRERDQDLVRVETGVLASEVGGLERLDRRDRLRGDDADLMRDAGDDLQGVQKSGRGRSEQLRGAARDERAVRRQGRRHGRRREGALPPGRRRGGRRALHEPAS